MAKRHVVALLLIVAAGIGGAIAWFSFSTSESSPNRKHADIKWDAIGKGKQTCH